MSLAWFWVHSLQPNHPWLQFRAKIYWLHKLHELPQLERWNTSCGLMHRKGRGHVIGSRLNHASSECAWRETERTSIFYAHYVRNGTHLENSNLRITRIWSITFIRNSDIRIALNPNQSWSPIIDYFHKHAHWSLEYCCDRFPNLN